MSIEELARKIKIDQPWKTQLLDLIEKEKLLIGSLHIYSSGEEYTFVSRLQSEPGKIYVEIENDGKFKRLNYFSD